jgi:predicted metal-dependent peptidase
MSVEDKCGHALAMARAFVAHKAPYVSKTLYGLVPYSAPGIETLGVSETLVLMVDPAWFIKLQLKNQGACLMHEISHVIRGFERMEAMPNRELANIAFDLPINYDMRAGGWELPHGNYPETFGLPPGLTGEQYYELLDKKCRVDVGFATKLNGMEKAVGSGRCGGCAGNPVHGPLEQELNRSIGRTTSDINHIRTITAADIRQFQQSRGNVPKTLEQWLPDEPDNRYVIRWRDKLSYIFRRAVGRIIAGRSDYSYRRPSRRSFLTGVVKPGMVGRQPVVAFVEDTSGSMGHEQLKDGRVQIVDIFLQLGIETAWWISADAAVSAPPRRLRMRDIRDLPVVGRGGTDFRPAIELAQTLRPRPDLLVYSTDGDGTAPNEPPPNMEVVFLIVPSHYNKTPATWGHTVIMADEIVGQ